MNDVHERSLVLSVDAFRRSLLNRVAIPEELLSEALSVTKAKLSAKRAKFFSHRGQVKDQREVEDHESQLRAADQIYTLAGVYAREDAKQRATASVALEYDPLTGTMRLLVGVESNDNDNGLPVAKSQQMTLSFPRATEAAPVEIRRRSSGSDSVWNVLVDEEDD